MTISKKLFWGFSVVLMLLITVTTVAIYALHRTQTSYDALVHVNAQLVDRVNVIGQSIREQVSDYRGAILYERDRDVYLERLHKGREQFDVTLDDIRKLTTDAEDIRILNEIVELNTAFGAAQNQVLTLIEDGELAQSVALSNAKVSPTSQRMIELVDQFRQQQLATVADTRAQLTRRAEFLTLLMVIVSAATIIAGLLISVFLGRGITGQLQESAAILSTSATEILATTTQLATGATETNTAISETTTTVEEVKQTAQLASEKARQVLESAQKAAQVSASGQQSVDDAIEGMRHIQTQMEAIAECIVRLSEQSQSIGEIIVVVGDLAEQSNLLAVNAAIEATRAGEQGKGFTVVAQEVKSLAEQSKQATKQVRSILSDIQQATSSAVLATEQGNKAVNAGVKQSTETGEVIRQLSENISEAADAATQIAASSHQQMIGMDQVALAMDNIRQASAQNAAGAKQAESAAQSLHDLGRKLIAMVSARVS